ADRCIQGQCVPGSGTCASFSDCCSGVCAQQVCNACTGAGGSCPNGSGCCVGLSCYQGTCGTCQQDNTACTLASQCCSNICDQGTCAACHSVGGSCSTGTDCCNGLCQSGRCQPEGVGGSCQLSTDCTSQVCGDGGICACSPYAGWPCTTGTDCCAGSCVSGYCPVPTTDLCMSCTDSSNCPPIPAGPNDLCVYNGPGKTSGNGYCAPACTQSSPCPSGTTCERLTMKVSGGGGAANVCWPSSGCSTNGGSSSSGGSSTGGSSGGTISTADLCQACTTGDTNCAAGNYCIQDPSGDGTLWCAPNCATGSCPGADPCLAGVADVDNINSYSVCYPSSQTCG
ncbi:MAG: hypothetical protein ACYDCL_21325, partial [Myxococcales bacterium]